jgi:hypothetical protein
MNTTHGVDAESFFAKLKTALTFIIELVWDLPHFVEGAEELNP